MAGWFDQNAPGGGNTWTTPDGRTFYTPPGADPLMQPMQVPTGWTPSQGTAGLFQQGPTSTPGGGGPVETRPLAPPPTFSPQQLAAMQSQGINPTTFGQQLQQAGQPTSTAGPAASAPGPGATTAPAIGSFSGNMTDDQVRALINQNISQGGAQNIDNGQYWIDAWNQWGKNDPGYFQSRLTQGIQQNTGQAGAGGAGSFGGGGGSPFVPFTGSPTAYVDPTQGPYGLQSLMGLIQDPTGILRQNPGYQFQQQQGLDALQRSAAARGTLLTGGTMKDLLDYSQGLADTTYGQTFGRLLGLNQQAYNQLQNQNIFGLNANQQFFGQNLGAASLGENAAAGQGSQGLYGAGQIGNYLTNIGNAGAAGQLASAGAWGNAFNNLGQFGMMYPFLQNMYPRTPASTPSSYGPGSNPAGVNY